MNHTTSGRVSENTSEDINQEIRRKTEHDIARVMTGGSSATERRLEELDREWDTERTLELNFALVVLVGIGLAAITSWWVLLLPLIAALFMVQHVLQGWCPPVPILRRYGFRTQREIDEERYALKALRGDFSRVPSPAVGEELVIAHRALEVAHR